MIYKILRVIANIAIRIFYGKIEVSGIENIPKDGPLLIASNHPNGFLEPIIMACLFPRPLHFMVRGDVFRKKWLKPILIKTNQIPIFRFKDGFSELRKNESSLRAAHEALENNAAIILFIEGGTENIKKLRSFQKGLGRMAYQFLDSHDQELKVLPVGINFTAPFRWRSRLNLNIAAPISANEHFRDEENPNKAINSLTDILYDRIENMVYNLKKDKYQGLLNKVLSLFEAFLPKSFPIVDYQLTNWKSFKAISERLNEMEDGSLDKLQKELQEFEIRNGTLQKRNTSILDDVLLIILLPFAMIGFIFNYIPSIAGKILANKVLDRANTVFRASIIVCSDLGFYIIFYLLVFLILLPFVGAKAFYILLMLPLGWIFIIWYMLFRRSRFGQKYQLSKKAKQRLISIFTTYNIKTQ